MPNLYIITTKQKKCHTRKHDILSYLLLIIELFCRILLFTLPFHACGYAFLILVIVHCNYVAVS